jgi:hypothetical protein
MAKAVAHAKANPTMVGGFIDVFQENDALERRLAERTP